MSKIVVANWKMNPASVDEAKKIASTSIKRAPRGVELIICPPYTFLFTLITLHKKTKVSFGAQDIFFEEKGAYTGEISAQMVKNSGGLYSIIGHSERRAMGETDEVIAKKVLAAIKCDLTPIICVGEKERDTNAQYLEVLKRQVESALSSISKVSLKKIIIAYEPVWAIGKEGKDAMNPSTIHETVILIRKIIVDKLGKGGRSVPIIYGGSVSPENTREIIKKGEVDGLLVGHQSLLGENFGTIMEEVSKA